MLRLQKKPKMALRAKSSSATPGVHSGEVFQAFLDHVRAVAERQHQVVSVLAFPLGNQRGKNVNATRLSRICTERLRATDVVGWLNEQTVGVLLPLTSPEDAAKVADSICSKMQNEHQVALTYKVYLHSNEHPLVVPAPNVQVLPLDDLCVQSVPVWKRVCDIQLSLLSLALCAPLMLLIAAYIKIVSPGPVFFRQERVGFRGRRFMLYKFRSMKVVADTHVHQQHLSQLMQSDVGMKKLDARDSRVIFGGKLMRASGLDELPQIFNILRGDMSFIGPRPCLPYEYEKYHPWHKRRCDAYPGLTGLWQVNGKNKTTFKEMMRFDISYAQRHNLRMDLAILVKTIPAILLQVWEMSMETRKAT